MDRARPHPFWTAAGFRDATGGELVRTPGSDSTAPITITCISTDTRTIAPGEAFLALRGGRFDGHAFVENACERGAALVVIDQRTLTEQACLQREDAPPVLLVRDTTIALQHLAMTWRGHLRRQTTVLGITGSCGKTTTKSMLHTVLSTTSRGTASPKSFNNHIGVPLSILAADVRDDYLILEIGTNAPGEIAALCEIAQPDVAIVTHVGRAHLEGLGSIEGITREKGALVRSISAERGWAIIPSAFPGLAQDAEAGLRLIRFGEEHDADVRLARVEPNVAGGSKFSLHDGSNWSIPQSGRHNVMNATATLAAARLLGLTDDAIQRGFLDISPASMRFESQVIGEIVIVNDAYNANPDSMRASIETFAEITHAVERGVEPGRVTLILGEMRELGEHSAACHREIADLACGLLAGRSVERVVFVGSHWESAVAGQSECDWHDQADDETMHALAETLRAGDHVLLKGSRGVALERIIPFVERLHENATTGS